MQQIIYCLAGFLALTSCVSNSSYSDLKDQYDSISQVNDRIEQEFFQTDSLVASVLGHFQEISHIENMINVNMRANESPRSEQERIRENMQQIYDRLDRSSEMIDNLSKQLELNGKDNAHLAGTISILRLQIEQQRAHVELFEKEVEGRTSTLQQLDTRIKSLRREAVRIRRDQELFDELLLARERQQNLVRYCIGTSSDLQQMGIVKSGAIDIATARLDYFTSADQTKLRELPIEAKKVRLISIHPANSYTLTPDGKNINLEITDPEGFWSYSRTLIIEVN